MMLSKWADSLSFVYKVYRLSWSSLKKKEKKVCVDTRKGSKKIFLLWQVQYATFCYAANKSRPLHNDGMWSDVLHHQPPFLSCHYCLFTSPVSLSIKAYAIVSEKLLKLILILLLATKCKLTHKTIFMS